MLRNLLDKIDRTCGSRSSADIEPALVIDGASTQVCLSNPMEKELLCELMDKKLNKNKGHSEKLVKFVEDRPGHDLRYAIDASKINSELGWRPSVSFEEGLSTTIDWYLENKEWLENISSGNHMNYYKNQYNLK